MSLLAGTVSYKLRGKSILSGVEVAIEEGECVAVVGVNGAGKTTLLRLLAGVLRPSGGGLALRGAPYRDIARRRLAQTLAYVPQARPVRVPLAVRDVVLLGRYPHSKRMGLGWDARDFSAVTDALSIVGIEDLADRPLDELSGGERQSAYIAAALAQKAECLILDEPTTFLDPGHQRRIAELLGALIDQHGRTVVFASHDLNLALALADRVLVLDDGKLVSVGPTDEVIRGSFLEQVYGAPFRVGSAEGRPNISVDLGTARASSRSGR